MNAEEQIEQFKKPIELIMSKLMGWGEVFIKNLPNLLIAILVILFFWFLSGRVYKIAKSSLKTSHFSDSLEHLIAYLIKTGILLLGFVFALSILNLEKTVFSMLAGVGVLGLALGFAFQDLASNFISGIMIAIRKPMDLGDIIEIDSVMGTVDEIKIRDTVIKNFDGQFIIVPNKQFMSNKFTNYSSNGSRRIKVEIGVGYDADLNQAKKVIKEALDNLDGTLKDPAPAVFVSSLGGSSVNLTCYVWIQFPGGDYLGVMDAAVINSKKALDAVGIDIPFPIRTLDLSNSAKDAINQFRPNS